MPKLELGPIAVTVSPGEGDDYLDAVAELGRLGYSTIWLSGGPLQRLDQIAAVLDATADSGVRVGSGIISVDRFDRASVAAARAAFEERYPGRFVLGLGGAHGPRPLRTLAGYLDELDAVAPAVPADARVLAALGPRMLQLARDRAAGAYPYLVTPAYTAQARSLLGGDATLIAGQVVALEADPEAARGSARGMLGFLTGRGGGYADNLQRMGFSAGEVAELPDRLVDALVAWGGPEAIAERVAEHLGAGADQVVLSLLSAGPPGTLPVEQLRQLACAVLPQR
jgi:probable F420-dependent oxidoreductase